jgi:hypothetical protein
MSTIQDMLPWLCLVAGSILTWLLVRMYFKSVIVHLYYAKDANAMGGIDMRPENKTMVVIAEGFDIAYENYSFLLVCNFTDVKTQRKLSARVPKKTAQVYATYAAEAVRGFQTLRVWIPYTNGVNLNESLHQALEKKAGFLLSMEYPNESVTA